MKGKKAPKYFWRTFALKARHFIHKIKAKHHKKKHAKKAKKGKKAGKKTIKLRNKLWKVARVAFKAGPRVANTWFKKLKAKYTLNKKKAAAWWKKRMALLKKMKGKKAPKYFWRTFALKARHFIHKIKAKVGAKKSHSKIKSLKKATKK